MPCCLAIEVQLDSLREISERFVDRVALSVQCPPAQRTGKVKILAGNTTAVVSVPGGISSASVGLATAQTNAGVAVQSVVPNVSAGTITIHLNKAPSQAVMVGWNVPN